ncbi:helix-turn-helix domain-containing protein [Shivajiella indica]|uniref:Helix-turn-helix domain-containing protein n=1 Tax=Shivajiella indica TaxID=872115 RepID=A0ABW5B8G9_9BACT
MIEIKKDDDFVKDLLGRKEGEDLDFKQSINKPSRIAKTMIAFANTKGGQIAVGISDQKKITGIDGEEEIYMIEKANREYCSPLVDLNFAVYEVDYLDNQALEEELYILLITIPKSNNDHFFRNHDGTYTKYIRKNDQTVPV